jgi:hypothetical protein
MEIILGIIAGSLGVVLLLYLCSLVVKTSEEIGNNKIKDLELKLKEISEDYWKIRVELESTKEKLGWNVRLAERYERDYLTVVSKFNELLTQYQASHNKTEDVIIQEKEK